MNLSTFNSQFSILILNGPNLNRLGLRKPDVYGSKTMAQILLEIQQNWPEVHFVYHQSNHEGDLIDWIQEANSQSQSPYGGVVLNAGGYSHTSIALRDAVEESEVPVVEVHISDTHAREPFRNTDMLSDVCSHAIIGHGTNGYKEAVQWLLEKTRY